MFKYILILLLAGPCFKVLASGGSAFNARCDIDKIEESAIKSETSGNIQITFDLYGCETDIDSQYTYYKFQIYSRQTHNVIFSYAFIREEASNANNIKTRWDEFPKLANGEYELHMLIYLQGTSDTPTLGDVDRFIINNNSPALTRIN